MPQHRELWDDFPSMQLVKTGSWIRFFGRVSFLLLLVGFISMFFLPWRQTARCSGTVIALDPQQRPQPFISPSEGVIGYVKPGLREGSFVEKGELLMKITPFASDSVRQVNEQIAAQKTAKTVAELSMQVADEAVTTQRTSAVSLNLSFDQDLKAARQKWEQAKGKVLEVIADRDAKENQLRIAEKTFIDGLETKEGLTNKRYAAEAARVKVENAERAADEAYLRLESKENEIESKRQDIQNKIREATQKYLAASQKIQSIEKELLDLQRKSDALKRLDIEAPRSGYIQNWTGYEESGTVKKSEKLFVIVPETTDLAVEMTISGNDLPLLKEGDPVRLQFEGFPAVQFVGWPSVAVGTFPAKVDRIFPTDDGKGNFRVIITPPDGLSQEEAWPERRYIRQGVRANGWVLLGEVKLGYEIWRQLNGFPPVVEKGKQEKAPKPNIPKP